MQCNERSEGLLKVNEVFGHLEQRKCNVKRETISVEKYRIRQGGIVYRAKNAIMCPIRIVPVSHVFDPQINMIKHV